MKRDTYTHLRMILRRCLGYCWCTHTSTPSSDEEFKMWAPLIITTLNRRNAIDTLATHARTHTLETNKFEYFSLACSLVCSLFDFITVRVCLCVTGDGVWANGICILILVWNVQNGKASAVILLCRNFIVIFSSFFVRRARVHEIVNSVCVTSNVNMHADIFRF